MGGREGGSEGREGWKFGEGGRGGTEGGREGGEGGGVMTVIHILMAPQYLNNNHVTYYVITQVDARLCHAVYTPNNGT